MPTSQAAAPRRGSLRTRWTLALLAVAALPLGAMTAATLRIQRAGLAQAEKELEVAVIDRVADTLERDLDFAGEATLRVGRVLTEGAIASDETRLTIARETMARAAALRHIAVYQPTGELVDTIVRVDEGRDPAAPARIPAALVQAPPREGVWLRAEFGSYGVALRYVVPLHRENGLRAWVVGTVSPRWVDTTLAGISRDRFGQPDRVLVVDDEVRLLSRGPGDMAVGTSIAGRDIFGGLALPRSAFASRFELTREFEAGEAMVGTLRTLPERRWAVAVRRPEREAFGALMRSRELLLAGVLVCAALAVVMGAVLAARTTKPIEALARLTRAYGQRRFGDRSAVRTNDELEELGGALERMADDIVQGEKELALRAKREADLGRFLPKEVAEAVARGDAALALGGARREVTVLFADVVAFTSFAEGAPPERVVAFLNELFTVLTEVVFRHGGMIDKFLGDCVMAVYGAGSEDVAPDAQARRALETAEDMHRFVEASAPAWLETYGIEAKLGIGVNQGPALVGNLGSESRMEYTAIGDVVNVAARLEALSRGGQTLVTAAVASAAGGDFTYHPLGAHPLRGKRETVEIFEVVS